MAMTVNEKYVKEWLNKLPGFDPADPKPGHYHIFLCPETGMVFKHREDTKAYTRKTGITDFLSIWAEVRNTGDGKWSIGKIDKNAPDAADTKAAQNAQAEWDRQKAAREQEQAQKAMEEELARQRQREAEERAASDMAAAEKVAYERRMAEEQAAREAAEREALERKFEENTVVVEANDTVFSDPGSSIRRHELSNFEHAYGKWVNDKLTRAGHDPIRIDHLLEDFYDGTVLKKLLCALTDDAVDPTKRVDMRPHNRFVVAANYAILWPFMTKPEFGQNIDLGGINAVNIWGERPMLKTLLNLIHKLQMKYDDVVISALLQWCKPRCAKYKAVDNFTTHWSDGTALLALYDSHFNTSLPKSDDANENLKLAFKKFSDDLGVAPLLDPEDLNCAHPESELVTMYIQTIKNAMEKASAPAAVTPEDLYKKAMEQTAKSSREMKQDCADTFNKTVTEFNTVRISDKDKIHEIISEAVSSVYDGNEEGFTQAHDLYDQAIGMLQELDGNPEQDKIDEITKAKKKSDKLPLTYRDDLYQDLLKAAEKWERDALMREGNHIFETTCSETETYITEIFGYIDSQVEKIEPENMQELLAVKNSAVKMVENKAAPGFDLATDRYQQAKDLCDKNKDKVLVDSKMKDVTEKMDEYKREVEHYASNKIDAMQQDRQLKEEDILNLYHQFTLDCAESINCLRPVGQLDDMGDADVPRRKGAAQYRLDKLLEVVKKSYDRDCALRKNLHVGVDALFDKEGMPL
jgi:hypothetical protein